MHLHWTRPLPVTVQIRVTGFRESGWWQFSFLKNRDKHLELVKQNMRLVEGVLSGRCRPSEANVESLSVPPPRSETVVVDYNVSVPVEQIEAFPTSFNPGEMVPVFRTRESIPVKFNF